jgi:hypothetical protein
MVAHRGNQLACGMVRLCGATFFIKNMKRYFVDDFKNVILSDHTPVLVEIDV